MLQPSFGVPYTFQELEAFNYFFQIWGDGNVFPASQAAQFKNSGIPQLALKSIWSQCARTNPMMLTKAEFCQALRMISMVQNNFDINSPISYQMYMSLSILYILFIAIHYCALYDFLSLTLDPVPPRFQGFVCFLIIVIFYFVLSLVF